MAFSLRVLGAHAVALDHDAQRDDDPDDDDDDVQDRDAPHAEAEVVGEDQHAERGADVAEPREEAVDGLLREVLHAPRGREPQHVAHGVVERVVERVLERLADADRGQRGRRGHRDRARERGGGEGRGERDLEAAVLDDARHEKELDEEARRVHVLEVLAEIRGDERVLLGLFVRLRGLGHELRDHVLACLVFTSVKSNVKSAMRSR